MSAADTDNAERRERATDVDNAEARVSTMPSRGAQPGGTAPRVVARAWDHADGVALRAAQRAEIAERYGTPDSEPGPAPTGDDIAVFLVAYAADGTPVGCGALRQLDAASAEIKRMFVDVAHRGTGVSVAVLRQLEAEAVKRGWPTLRLETGTEQPDAVRFYTREGYEPIPKFGHYVHSDASLCFARSLVG
jgi:putative acetyltransferase